MLYHPILLYLRMGWTVGFECWMPGTFWGVPCCVNLSIRTGWTVGLPYEELGTLLEVLYAVLEPKIQVSYCSVESCFGYKASHRKSWVNMALNTNSWLFFSFLCFGFHTSVSLLRFPHYSIFYLPQMINSLNVTGVYIHLIYSTLPISTSNVIIHLHCIWVVTAQRSGAYQLFGINPFLFSGNCWGPPFTSFTTQEKQERAVLLCDRWWFCQGLSNTKLFLKWKNHTFK